MKISRRASRVYLRHPRWVDVDRFLELVYESRSLHHPWVHPPGDEQSFRKFVERSDTDRCQGLLVFRRDDDRLVGVVDLTEIVRGTFQSAYMGFYGSLGCCGQGYMTEGVQTAIKYAFSTLRIHRIEANIQPANLRSLRLAQRCGLRREGYSPRYLKIGGRWRDHERWAILSDY